MYGEAELSVIDLVEEYLEVAGWTFVRSGSHVISFEFIGAWNKYQFTVAEKENRSEAFVQCQLTFRLPTAEIPTNTPQLQRRVIIALRDLFDLIHGELPRGTFHSLPVTDDTVSINWVYRFKLGDVLVEQLLEDTLNEAMEEIDEFYPALCLVLTGKYRAAFALEKAIPPAYGCA